MLKMVESSIVMPLNDNDDRCKDVQNVNAYHKTKFMLYRSQAIAEQQKATKEHKPYDFQCAMRDIKKAQIELYSTKKPKGVKSPDDVEISFDAKEYHNAKRFIEVRKVDWVEDKLIDNIKKPTIVGSVVDFQSKETGAKYTIYVPDDNLKPQRR